VAAGLGTEPDQGDSNHPIHDVENINVPLTVTFSGEIGTGKLMPGCEPAFISVYAFILKLLE
jgi:hypothetical protein